MDLWDALARRRTGRSFAAAPLSRSEAERLVWAAQGVTGPEGHRTAPSAHALHPLRLRAAVRGVEGLAPGLYDPEGWHMLAAGEHGPALAAAAIDDQPWLAEAPLVLAIAADMAAAAMHFADQPPYGARGLRYGWLEAGAAMQNVLLAAAALGLSAVPVAGFRDEATATALCLPAPLWPAVLIGAGRPG